LQFRFFRSEKANSYLYLLYLLLPAFRLQFSSPLPPLPGKVRAARTAAGRASGKPSGGLFFSAQYSKLTAVF
jgi:hypothetical protein